MNIIIKSIKDNIKNQMKEMKFKVKGQNYIRIVNNQVYQAINFQRSVSGDRFTINIAILPIFAGDSYFLFPHIRIGEFISGVDVWYDYSEESVHEVVDVINKKILPVMNFLTTYERLYMEIESALDNKLNLDNNERNYKSAIVNTSGMINLFWLCFKNNKYDRCKKILEWEKNDIKKWLDRCLEVDNEYKKNAISERFIKKIEENDNKLMALAHKRTSDVDNLYILLENNEIEKLTAMVDRIEKINLEKYKKFLV